MYAQCVTNEQALQLQNVGLLFSHSAHPHLHNLRFFAPTDTAYISFVYLYVYIFCVCVCQSYGRSQLINFA